MSVPDSVGTVRNEYYERLRINELDASARALRDKLVNDDRRMVAGQPPIAAPDGTLNGPFGAFLFAPSIGQPLQELGAALRTGTSLTTRERELAILALAAALHSDYELSVHVPIARAAGVSEHEIEAAIDGDPLDDARSHALVRFCHAHARSQAPRIEFDALARRFTRQEVVEILALAAYYRGLAAMLELLRIEPDVPADIPISPRPQRSQRSDAEYDLSLLMEEREITRVLMGLASCVDSLDFEGLAQLYAEDGELVTPWGSHRGRDGLAEYVSKDIGVYKALHHVSAGHEIDVIPGAHRARARMTLLASHVTDDAGERFRSNGGHYEIQLVREHGVWCLENVRIVPAWSFQSDRVWDDAQ